MIYYNSENINNFLENKYKMLMNTPINNLIIGTYVKIGKNRTNIKYGKVIGFDKYHRCIIDISYDIFEEHFIILPVYWGNLEDIKDNKLENYYSNNKNIL